MTLSLPNSSWKRRPDASRVVYERPLGTTEFCFYWDSIFERTADTLQHVEVEVDHSISRQAIDFSNFERTWLVLKQRFPLLGAQLEERNQDTVFFKVDEGNLQKIMPGEITFQKISSSQEASVLVQSLVSNKKMLSNDLLACVFVLERTDLNGCFHLIIQVAHSITDGMANISILKSFLDQLCKPMPPSPNLQERLSLSVSSEELVRHRKLSEARKRWRRAIAAVLASKGLFRMNGGHTLPRKISQCTPHIPPKSRTLAYSFDPHTSNLIISSCRKNQITFGNAYPIIGQIAVTRVLLGRYLRGEIGEEEWEFRKKEPMISAGPLSLRGMLDEDWFKAGGMTNVSLSIGFFAFSLPFMPLGKAGNLKPGMPMPPFEDILSTKRFLHRAKGVKVQAARYIKHPLFMEINAAGAPGRIQRVRSAAIQWRTAHAPPNGFSDRQLSPQEQAANGLVFCNGGSSMGNVDALLPLQYPLGEGNTSKPPLVKIKKNTTVLRCRPSELYLGASTSRKSLHVIAYWDNNVFEEGIVAEWLEEVRAATDFYLGNGTQVQGKL